MYEIDILDLIKEIDLQASFHQSNEMCWKIVGDTLEERYASYRKKKLLHFFLCYVVHWIGVWASFNWKASSLEMIFNVCILITGGTVMTFSLAIMQTRHGEPYKRQMTVASGVIYLIPAVMCLFISLKQIRDSARDLEEVWRIASSFAAYLTGTAVGIGSAAQYLSHSLNVLGYNSQEVDRLHIVTTYIGVSTRIAGWLILTQLYSMVDPGATIYAVIFHLIYIVHSRAKLKRSNIWIAGCWFSYLVLWVVILSRFGKMSEESQELVLQLFGTYLHLTLQTSITILMIGWMTSQLFDLVILLHFMPSLPTDNQVYPDNPPTPPISELALLQPTEAPQRYELYISSPTVISGESEPGSEINNR